MLSCLCAFVSILCHCVYPSNAFIWGEGTAVCISVNSLSSVNLFICCVNIDVLLVEKGILDSQLVSMYVYYYYSSFFKWTIIHCLAFFKPMFTFFSFYHFAYQKSSWKSRFHMQSNSFRKLHLINRKKPNNIFTMYACMMRCCAFFLVKLSLFLYLLQMTSPCLPSMLYFICEIKNNINI